MKFTDGFWMHREGVNALYAQEAYEVTVSEGKITVLAPTKVIDHRGDTLNRPSLTVTYSSPMPGVVAVDVVHWAGRKVKPGFDLVGVVDGASVGTAELTEDGARLTTGGVTVDIRRGAPWQVVYSENGKVLTRSGHRSLGYHTVQPGARVEPIPTDVLPGTATYVHEQLDLAVGEHIYGMGERFGQLVKNGQSVDIWNADPGSASEQAYKNVPFYLSDRGYGVLVDHRGHVSFEVGSEAVERVQFSVRGERLRYLLIGGGSPKGVLERYTALTGRPPRVPAWSFGLWLSTSFTTSYDETTVMSFVDEMAAREIPLSVFHFDCFWMKGFHWTDFTWDSETFPDPAGIMQRLHERDLRVCVWINPYIAQAGGAFDEAAEAGYLVRRPDGDVWQWDMWQAGMGLVDFTNPAAKAWYQDKLRGLLRQGVDCFKTDFGERIPLDVVWHDGSDPESMRNWYAQAYNEAVFEVLVAERGEGEAILFARTATAGGQRLPVHWGGDNTSTFASMAETLRGGLSLTLSGFGYWSHDIGGFEGTPDADVFKRWLAFGLMSTHSRLHGSRSYRVPWSIDAESDDVARFFTRLKLRLMPYLTGAGLETAATGVPMMRAMVLEFPGDRNVAYLDAQYMLGGDLLVAPVLDASGEAELYLPEGRWTNLLTGDEVDGGRWLREKHGYLSMPLYVREGAVLALSTREDRPDHPYLDALVLEVYPGDGTRTVTVTEPDGRAGTFTVERGADEVVVTGAPGSWSVRLPGGETVASLNGRCVLTR